MRRAFIWNFFFSRLLSSFVTCTDTAQLKNTALLLRAVKKENSRISEVSRDKTSGARHNEAKYRTFIILHCIYYHRYLHKLQADKVIPKAQQCKV